ncbi:MAG: chromate efflux transporter [Alphaproteobacteria bacterium]
MDRNPRYAGETFLIFLRLGLTSFGGPVAHIGYFREAFVTRHKWLSDPAYAELVAICQFLPGPASSQVGFAIGLGRAGFLGALAAWVGFTAPSAIIMTGLALGVVGAGDGIPAGVLQGLKIAALAVVAQAAWSMGRSLAPDAPRALLAVAGTIIMLLFPGIWTGVAVIAAAALIGRFALPASEAEAGEGLNIRVPHVIAIVCLALFALLLVGLPLAAASMGGLTALFDVFYRAGALVFGGGHVVLPLLEAGTVPDHVDRETFLAGYGAAQAVPGPLFTFAAFLGGAAGGIAAALVCLVAIFLGSFLLLVGVLPFWSSVRSNRGVTAALTGVNAAVVGLILAALYDPVFVSAVRGPVDLALGAAAFAALMFWKTPSWAVVILCAGLGFLLPTV